MPPPTRRITLVRAHSLYGPLFSHHTIKLFHCGMISSIFFTFLFPSVNPVFLMFVLQHLVLTMTSILLPESYIDACQNYCSAQDMQEVHRVDKILEQSQEKWQLMKPYSNFCHSRYALYGTGCGASWILWCASDTTLEPLD